MVRGKRLPNQTKNQEVNELIMPPKAAKADRVTIRREEFISFYNDCLDNEQICAKINNTLKPSFDEVHNRIDEIIFENEDRDAHVAKVSNTVDILEQQSRERNLIITGTKLETNPTEMVKKLNKLLDINIRADDVDYLTKFKNKEDTYKIVFYTKRARDLVFAKKKILKEKEKRIWIAEDLTQKNATLFYHARQAVRRKEANTTWTAGGNVFIKKEDDSTPVKVTTQKQLNDTLGIVPLIHSSSSETF